MNCHNLFANKDLTAQYALPNISTNVKNPLQINQNMQNKPKLQKPKMTISYCTKRTYKDFFFLEPPKNKPKTNPKSK